MCDELTKLDQNALPGQRKGILAKASSFNISSEDMFKSRKDNTAPEDIKLKLSEFIVSEIDMHLENSQRSCSIHFLKALICGEIQSKKCKALYEIMKAEECTPNLRMQFQIYSLKTKIKSDIISEEIKKDSTSKSSMTRVVKYYQSLIQLQDLLALSVSIYELFWTQIKTPNPNFMKLLDYIRDVANNNEVIKSNIFKIQTISPSDIKATMLYSAYLKIIEEDYSAAAEQYNKYKSKSSLGKACYDDIESRFGVNSFVSVVIVSGNKSNIGTILNCNHEIVDITGHCKEELIGKNLDMLMPSLIGAKHNKLIEGFYDHNSSQLREAYSEKQVIALHKIGYIVPAHITIRMLQSNDNDITFIGFLRVSKTLCELRLGDEAVALSDVYVFLLSSTNILLGFNIEMAELISLKVENLDINKYHSLQKKIDMSTYYEAIFAPENEDKVYGSNGLCIDLDLANIKDSLEKIVKDFNETGLQSLK